MLDKLEKMSNSSPWGRLGEVQEDLVIRMQKKVFSLLSPLSSLL